MKKFLILILTALVTVVAHAQIFTKKEIKDKFDDVVSGCEIKTLVEINDTAIIIEEKGNEPVTYIIDKLHTTKYTNKGSKDNIVHLVDNVYGYQENWWVVLEKDIEDFLLYKSALCDEEDASKIDDLISKLIEEYYYLITHCVVTDKYGTKLLYEYYCIEKVSKKVINERTIYSKYY